VEVILDQRRGFLTNIRYLEVKVTHEEIENIKKVAIDTNNPNRRLASMQLGYIRELAEMQKEGLHTSYMEDDEQLICTCGLALFDPKVSINTDAGVKAAEYLNPDLLARHSRIVTNLIHTVRGHQRLPRCRDRAVALIYELEWNDSQHTFVYNAFCQECMKKITRVPGKEARIFVRIHNKKCGNITSKQGSH
jgi:hypothetical protein